MTNKQLEVQFLKLLFVRSRALLVTLLPWVRQDGNIPKKELTTRSNSTLAVRPKTRFVTRPNYIFYLLFSPNGPADLTYLHWASWLTPLAGLSGPVCHCTSYMRTQDTLSWLD